jgi:DNA-binding response OmpR family regulator
MMRLTLEAAGYEVAEARDGTEGISAFGDGSNWAGVILDQRMPGLGGLEVLRQIKQRDQNARVVMATAYASIELAVDALKLGATDFVRKPMTPEILRNALTAALTKSAADRVETRSTRGQPLPIQTITMNGFTIIDDEALEALHRRFIVTSPEGQEHEVLIEIDEEVVGYVQRMTGRRLNASDSFWTAQARRVLSDFLWNEGKVPPTRRLVLRDLAPDKLAVAQRWHSEEVVAQRSA